MTYHKVSSLGEVYDTTSDHTHGYGYIHVPPLLLKGSSGQWDSMPVVQVHCESLNSGADRGPNGRKRKPVWRIDAYSYENKTLVFPGCKGNYVVNLPLSG